MEETERSDHHKQSGEESVQLRRNVSSSRGGLTSEYASPEQLRGDDEVSFASDIYNFSATLYKLLTGTVPIRKTIVGEIRAAAINGTFDPPRVCVTNQSPKHWKPFV